MSNPGYIGVRIGGGTSGRLEKGLWGGAGGENGRK